MKFGLWTRIKWECPSPIRLTHCKAQGRCSHEPTHTHVMRHGATRDVPRVPLGVPTKSNFFNLLLFHL